MKDKLKTLILPVLFYIVLFAANLYFLKSYYAFSSESIQLVKNALVSSGLNESQSFSIASSISGRVENTYVYLSTFQLLTINLLMILIFHLYSVSLELKKEVNNIREKINV